MSESTVLSRHRSIHGTIGGARMTTRGVGDRMRPVLRMTRPDGPRRGRAAWRAARRAGLQLAVAVSLLVVGLPNQGLAAKPAASTPALPEPLTRENIRELVSGLSDESVRALLMQELDRRAAPPPEAGAASAGLAENANRIHEAAGVLLRAIPAFPERFTATMSRFSEGGHPHQLLLAAILFAVMIGAGALVERLAGRVLARLWEARVRATEDAPVLAVLGRVVLGLVLIVVFGLTAAAVFLLVYQGHDATRELLLSAFVMILGARLAVLASRMLLAPHAADQRLLPFDDSAAQRLHRGLRTLAALVVVALLVRYFFDRWGPTEDAEDLPATLTRLVILVVFVRLVWAIRRPIAGLIRGDRGSLLRRLAADAWPVLMTIYALVVVSLSTVEELSERGFHSYVGLQSLLVILLMPLVSMFLCRLVDRRAARAPADGALPRFAPILRQAVQILVTAGGLYLIAQIWDLDLIALTEARMGERVARALVDAALTILLAYLVWQLAKTAIDSRLAREAGPTAVSDAGEAGGVGASRLRTLLPLLRGFLFATICTMTVMTILAALGVNIGPLLAGAGVVGLALGFGAQTLVRDVISGAFYLMDDAFRLGEYIDVGDAKGTVEKIGVRSMQLRHHRGSLNVVPYGAIRRLNNQSRDWVVEKIEFRLTYDTDIVKVKKIIKKIGQQLAEDPEIGRHIIEPLKSQGVLAMEDSALLVKAKFTARPGEQFVIRREAYQRVKQAFTESGIQFAHRQVTVFVPPGTPVGPVIAAAGAAGVAADGPTPSE
jgi:moderate conductance mechanosensitive channel